MILGTSRSDGNTRASVDFLIGERSVELIDLAAMDVSAYDYWHANRADSFLPLIEQIIGRSLWLFATPVYWYTMSAQMKVFVDRLSDLVTIRKDLGRSLRGKSVGVIASGTDDELPEGFEAPFRLTCDYFDMTYIGAVYVKFGKDGRAVRDDSTKARAVGASWIA